MSRGILVCLAIAGAIVLFEGRKFFAPPTPGRSHTSVQRGDDLAGLTKLVNVPPRARSARWVLDSGPDSDVLVAVISFDRAAIEEILAASERTNHQGPVEIGRDARDLFPRGYHFDALEHRDAAAIQGITIEPKLFVEPRDSGYGWEGYAIVMSNDDLIYLLLWSL